MVYSVLQKIVGSSVHNRKQFHRNRFSLGIIAYRRWCYRNRFGLGIVIAYRRWCCSLRGSLPSEWSRLFRPVPSPLAFLGVTDDVCPRFLVFKEGPNEERSGVKTVVYTVTLIVSS